VRLRCSERQRFGVEPVGEVDVEVRRRLGDGEVES